MAQVGITTDCMTANHVLECPSRGEPQGPQTGLINPLKLDL